MAELAIERLGEPPLALDYVARALEASGLSEKIIELTRRALEDPTARTRAAELLERASAASEKAEAIRIMELLLEATEHAPELRDTRKRWCDRLLELSADDARASAAVALRTASSFPSSMSSGKRPRNLPSASTTWRSWATPISGRSPRRSSPRSPNDSGVARPIFRAGPGRAVGGGGSAGERAPIVADGALALDRVKLTLSVQRRYEELLALYDRAIRRPSSPNRQGRAARRSGGRGARTRECARGCDQLPRAAA